MCLLASFFLPVTVSVLLKDLIVIFYTIIAIFVKLKFAFKAFLG